MIAQYAVTKKSQLRGFIDRVGGCKRSRGAWVSLIYEWNRGIQQIVSVNYLFGRPLIPYNFLTIIFASNFRYMGNFRPGVFGLIKMSFRVPKKVSRLRFSKRK